MSVSLRIGKLPPLATARAIHARVNCGVFHLGMLLWATLSVCHAPAAEVAYRRDVLPLLSDRCFKCHGPDSASRQASLRLDDRDVATAELESGARAIVPGDREQSALVERILSEDPALAMPPVDSGKTLSEEEKQLLVRWVEAGAEFEPHWAFVAPVRPVVPQAERPHLVNNPIDAFVQARLAVEGLEPLPRASKERLIRRVHFDLIGLPPTIAEIDAFVADESPNAFQRVVDRLFESPHYGERMAADWLDGARYADSNGYQNDFARHMWPWRDWVISAFNAHISYDQFVIEQLAGDLLPGATLQQRIATGFNRNHRTVTEAGSIEEEWHVENVVDRVETTGTVFLGLTIGCARCHDHKFDPITQRDFYQFFAFFNNVNEKGVYTETRGNVPPLVKLMTSEHEQKLAEFDSKINKLYVNLATIGAFFGFHREFAGNSLAYVLGAKRALEAAQAEKAAYDAAIPTTMVMEERAEQRETYLLQRGRYDEPDKSERLTPDVPSALPAFPANSPRNRLGLARWLVSRENPLAARVIVNRLWQKFFGLGLVKTPDNFGIQTEPPSHPELLDWLAVELMDSGWDLEHIQRLIISSHTYQQQSEAAPELYKRDPENRLLARGPRHRLPAEAVRDNALAVSGLLVRKVGGPSVMPYQPAGLWEELAGGAFEVYTQGHGDDLYRRGLYVYRKRTVPHPAMGTFDAPSWEICQVKRATTNTPLQALALLNDVTYVEAARKFAERMMIEGGNTAEERMTFAFRSATGRLPTPAELATLLESLARHTARFRQSPAAAEQFVSHGESPRDSSLDVMELAAHTAVASVLLNMDETVSKN
ncbi:MAG TPA: PSD1 and planctomycete cytochrome C domain-containing protein, partial [Lacipirellulaceae bacterium]